MKKQKNDQIVERKIIENTPFMAVRYDKKWILVCGQYRITNVDFSNYQEIETYLQTNIWEVIPVLITIVTESINEAKK